MIQYGCSVIRRIPKSRSRLSGEGDVAEGAHRKRFRLRAYTDIAPMPLHTRAVLRSQHVCLDRSLQSLAGPRCIHLSLNSKGVNTPAQLNFSHAIRPASCRRYLTPAKPTSFPLQPGACTVGCSREASTMASSALRLPELLSACVDLASIASRTIRQLVCGGRHILIMHTDHTHLHCTLCLRFLHRTFCIISPMSLRSSFLSHPHTLFLSCPAIESNHLLPVS